MPKLRKFDTKVQYMKYKVLREVARLAWDGTLDQHRLDIPKTNLSFHLKAIVHSGLVDVEREGRFMRYKANIPLMLDIVGYLTEECCSGNPEACQRFRDASPVSGILPKRVD